MADHPLDAVSLRLLRLFETVFRTRNLSRAADELNSSQPSVSLSLARLRRHFDDALFVRVGATMAPTPRAEELIAGVRLILGVANDYFVGRAPFDPATSDRRFTLHMSDPAEAIVMPRLLERLAVVAPRVRLAVRGIDDASQPALADGKVDLIVGRVAREAEQLAQAKLHDETYVGIARTGHSRIGDRPGLAAFAAEGHVVVVAAGHRHGPGAGRLPADTRVVLEVSGYLAVGATVARTELVAVVPSRLGAQLAAAGGVRTFVLPVPSPVFPVRLYWHPRFHHDVGNRWLRGVLTGLVTR